MYRSRLLAVLLSRAGPTESISLQPSLGFKSGIGGRFNPDQTGSSLAPVLLGRHIGSRPALRTVPVYDSATFLTSRAFAPGVYGGFDRHYTLVLYRIKYSDSTIVSNTKKFRVHDPGIEPGFRRWQRRILPLDQPCKNWRGRNQTGRPWIQTTNVIITSHARNPRGRGFPMFKVLGVDYRPEGDTTTL